MRGGPKPPEFIYKKLSILTCLNFSHLQSTHCLMQYIHQDFFSTAQNSFWNCRFWCLLALLPFFVHLFHIGKMFPCKDFFCPGKQQKKVAQGLMGWIGRVGHRCHAVLVQNCWTLSAQRAGLLVNHPSWKGQVGWKSLQKNSLNWNTTSHNNASWYTDTDGFLEHSSSGGSLY